MSPNMFMLILTCCTSFAMFLLGILVLVRDARSAINRLFFFLSLFVAIWVIGNFFSNDQSLTYTMSLVLNHAALLFSGLSLLFILCFLASFTRLAGHVTASARYGIVWGLAAVYALSLSPLIIQGLTEQGGRYGIDFGRLAVLYFAAIFVNAVMLFLSLIWGLRHVSGADHARLLVIAWSITGAVVVSLATNAVLPFLADSFALTNLGPLSTILVIIAIFYSIARHKLFDIRSTIARSLGYIFSIIVLASAYGFIIFGITKYGFNLSIPVAAQVLLAAATGLAGLFFPYLRRQFDRLTNQLFYRDAYDPQQLFSQLNSMLVTSLDTNYLMMQSVSIVETALKPEFALIGLRQGDSQRIFGSRKVQFSDDTIARVRRLTPRIHHKVIAADYIEDDRHAELRDMMRDNNVSVIVRLTQDVRKTEEGLGYLVLGPRKSGNPYTPQDLRVLDTVANELIIAIQNALHYEEIQRFNVTLQGRVEEATRKLRHSNQKLKALDETKDDFISMASHQLRTPLTSVKGYLSMVLEGDAGTINATQAKMLGQAFISSQRMVYLIADLLNVSRLRTGKFVIEAQPTNLAKLIDEELAQLVETAQARDIELTFAKPRGFPELNLDETKTRQVIMNFVDNAIYYTPAGGHIKVELKTSDHSVELRVIDDGIGVPRAEQHHLFTKFYRAKNAQKARPDGTGLGLFMAKKVVLAQGGNLIFDSKEGKGSTFGFAFPRSKVAVDPAALPVAPIAVAAPVKPKRKLAKSA